MAMTTMTDNRFELRSTDPHSSEYSMLVQTQSAEQHREWVSTIDNELQKQHNFLKALQNPIEHGNMQKES